MRNESIAEQQELRHLDKALRVNVLERRGLFKKAVKRSQILKLAGQRKVASFGRCLGLRIKRLMLV